MISLLGSRILVLAPHPDDEILGCGGTIAAATDAGVEVRVAVVTTGRPDDFPAESIAQVRGEAERAHRLLGAGEPLWLGQPAARLTEVPHVDLNRAVADVVRLVEPDVLLVPFVGDLHRDHREVFESALVAARPHGPRYPATILAYETLSETNWNAPGLAPAFVPNVFVDIAATLERKLAAMALFESQRRDPPHERSLATLRALATLRGGTVHRSAAEGFMLIRQVI